MTRRSTSSGSPIRIASSRASSGVAAAAAIVPIPRAQHDAGPAERLVERAVREVGGHHRVGAEPDQDRRFEGDRLIVGLAQSAQVDDRLPGRDAEAVGLGGRGRADDPGQHARAGNAPGAAHLLA